MGLAVSVSASVKGFLSGAAGVAAQVANVADKAEVDFVTGSALDQASKLYTQAVNIAASSSETLDLTTLADALGAALAFNAIKAVYLRPDAANSNNIVLGNAASNPWSAPFDAATDTVSTTPGGCTLLLNPSAAGWTVDSTHKALKLANSGSGSAVTGTLILIGD